MTLLTTPGAPVNAARLASYAARVAPSVPRPGSGGTAHRFGHLDDLAAGDLAFAKLAEAHLDALAILAEAGRRAADVPYAVWAAERPGVQLRADPQPDGRWRVTGAKPWCTGAGLVERALVTAASDDGVLLVDIDLADARWVDDGWEAQAFAAAPTRRLILDVVVDGDALVGHPGWYLERPGFWIGAIGVAACWAGGLRGLVRRVDGRWRSDPHSRAARGAAATALWGCEAVLERAARSIDRLELLTDPTAAVQTALTVRSLVEQHCTTGIRRVREGCGPGPFAAVADIERHTAELELYLRQCHGERDLAALGDALAAPST